MSLSIDKKLKRISGPLDQGIISATNLLIGFLILHEGGKEIYGAYVMLIGISMLIQSIQNAVIISPMMTLIAKSEENQKNEFNLIVSKLYILLIIISAVFSLAYSSLFLNYSILNNAVAIFTASLGLMARENARNKNYINHHPDIALKKTLIFSCILFTCLFLLKIINNIDATTCLFSIGIAGIITVDFQKAFSKNKPCKISSKSWHQYRECVKWALPSVIISWAGANGYIYSIAHFTNTATVGLVAATRLLISPISLFNSGISNILRPNLSILYKNNNFAAVNKKISRINKIFLLGIFLYGILLIIFSFIKIKWLNNTSPGIIAAWIFYSATNATRTLEMNKMLCSEKGYKPLFKYNLFAFIVTLPFIVLFPQINAIAICIYILGTAEIIQIFLIRRHGWPSLVK